MAKAQAIQVVSRETDVDKRERVIRETEGQVTIACPQAVPILGMSVDAVYKAARSGQLSSCAIVVGQSVYIDRAKLIRFIEGGDSAQGRILMTFGKCW